MSLSFRCSCGQSYRVGEELAGKTVRCKQCGSRLRIPEPADSEPTTDVFGLDDAPAVVSETAAPPEALERRPTEKLGQRSKSRSKPARALRGFLKAIPRGDELRYPLVGVGAVILTLVIPFLGLLATRAYLLFVPIAAVVIFLWACGSGLATAARQSSVSALILCPALIATAIFDYLLMLPNPITPRLLGVAAIAVVCYLAFFLHEERGKDYREPIALGILATLLVASFVIILTIARINMARRGIT